MFKSIEEINKHYEDHLHSLRMWGGEFSADGVYAAWVRDIDTFLAPPDSY